MTFESDRASDKSGVWVGRVLVAALAVAGCDGDGATPDEVGGAPNSNGGEGPRAGATSSAGGAGQTSGGASAQGGAASRGGTGSGGTMGPGGRGPDGGLSSAGAATAGSTSGHGGEGGNGGSTSDLDAGDDDAGAAAIPVVIDARTRAQLARLTPLPDAPPPDPTNRVADDDAAAELGQMLFFDPLFSGKLAIDSDLGLAGQAGLVSCASCHSSPNLDDERSDPPTVAIGAGIHTRNAPALVNSSFYTWTNWGGRFSAQWELPLAVVEAGVIMAGNRLQIAHRIFDVYREEYEDVFGDLDPDLATTMGRFPAEGKPKPAPTPANPMPADGPWEAMDAADRVIINTILVNYSKAIAAYMRRLTSSDSPFDRWMAGDADAISRSAQRGATVFVDVGCVQCHSGPHFSDGAFHALGVPQEGDNVPTEDDGRHKDAPVLLGSAFNSAGVYSDDAAAGQLRLAGLTSPMPESTRKAFRTPSLRGVALTAPYMHSGQIATLEDVIEFYNRGGTGSLIPLAMSAEEKSDLLAFLVSLTNDPVAPALLEDTSR